MQKKLRPLINLYTIFNWQLYVYIYIHPQRISVSNSCLHLNVYSEDARSLCRLWGATFIYEFCMLVLRIYIHEIPIYILKLVVIKLDLHANSPYLQSFPTLMPWILVQIHHISKVFPSLMPWSGWCGCVAWGMKRAVALCQAPRYVFYVHLCIFAISSMWYMQWVPPRPASIDSCSWRSQCGQTIWRCAPAALHTLHVLQAPHAMHHASHCIPLHAQHVTKLPHAMRPQHVMQLPHAMHTQHVIPCARTCHCAPTCHACPAASKVMPIKPDVVL